MTVTDHAHPITPDMPVYPGTEPPVIHPADPVGATVFDNHLAFENGDGSPVRAVAMTNGAFAL